MNHNTTIGRRPGNNMKANASTVKPRVNASQMDQGLAADGMMGDGVNRAKNVYAKNQYTGHSNDGRLVNFGMMASQRVGNASSSPRAVGPSPTRDPHKKTIATAAQGGKIDGGTKMAHFPNPDAINMGMK
jgi:hypothetical protein